MILQYQALLEKLPTVGDVTVHRDPAPAKYSSGFTWTITFETQIDNLEPLAVDGNSTAIPIVGANAELSVVEIRRGRLPQLDLDITGLEAGEAYIARVSAQNAAGFGPTTLADTENGGEQGSNNQGLGIVPFRIVTRTAPIAPSVAKVVPVSASQLDITLEAPDPSLDSNILGYKVRSDVEYMILDISLILDSFLVSAAIIRQKQGCI